MKPDGVTTAALEPMETLDANPAPEDIPAAGQEPNQAASPVEGEVVPPPNQDEPQEPSKETPAKPNNKKPTGDAKSKTPSKTAKTKPGTTPTKSAAASKTTPGRISNGVSKPQTNGVPKKTTPASDKKSTPLTKRPTGTTPTPKSAPKPTAERKTPTALTNGAKTTTTAAAKKTPTSANGVKTSSATAAAKKPAAPKAAATTATKPSSAASPKPDKGPVPKTTRTPSGTSATRPPSSSTTKSSAAAPKPKPSTPSSKPPTSKPTAPSAGKTPASQTSKTTTPVKKDVSKPATSAAKKPTESPYARANLAPKPAKQDVPKSTAKPGTAAKKPTPIKAADSKTPTRPKPETKAPSSKDASKTPKPAAPKTTSPKKTVGSSTPTPVKRGPKATESNKEVAVAAATAAATAAAATAAVAAVIAKPEEQPPPAEANIQEPKVTPDPFMELPEQPKAEPYREPTPEPYREPTPEPVRDPSPEPVREPSPEPVREPSPEPVREPSPESYREPSPEAVRESTPESHEQKGAEVVHDVFEKTSDTSVTSLGTTVLSPPCSPTGPVSPAREVPSAALLDFQSDLMNVQNEHKRAENTNQEEDEEEESKENENLFMGSSAPFAVASSLGKEPQSLSTTSPFDGFASGGAVSPQEKEEAVEKAEEEINEDDDDEDEDDEEQRRFGLQPSSMITDLSSSQPSEDIQRSSAFGGSMGWHGDDLLSGMDSEDMSSCTSSRQQGVSDLSSTQHTAILEGTQSSDALVDSSLRGSEGDANLTGSPNVETIANEEEDEDEEDERVDDMDLSSERAEEHHKVFSAQEHEEEDEDVEMHSEGKTESGGNVDEDFNEDEHSLNQSGLQVSHAPTAAWGHSNPFNDSWSQPASLLPVSSPSPKSEQGAADSETPTQSPAQPCLDSSAPPTFCAQSEEELSPKASELLSAPARAEGSESSTPEELREYDSSSGVESRSDKQHTPVPTQGPPDLEQDLGIHMEKADGEEEEAETLPADEVLGTGPPTAPASAPSSASTSGDEASDTEGEMQINDPDAPLSMGERACFDSPTPASNFDEDEEVRQAASAEPEEDGGGATPQSANSVGSYGFDCTNSNSNAHSMAESCGKSPGIFSLENEEQLPEEAKDPSLIKELTLPSAGAAAEDLLGRPVNLMPLGPGDHSGVDAHHYMMSNKMGADLLHDVDPEEPGHLLDHQDSGDSDDNQPPYYSTICDKTDNFLEGNHMSFEEDEDMLQSPESYKNQNRSEGLPIANGHYLALVPGNRRPIDPALAAQFAPLLEAGSDSAPAGEQLRQEQQEWPEEEEELTEEEERLEQQLQEQRQELLQLQQQQELQQRQSRQRLQWQLELELQYRMHQKQLQQQQQLRRSPTGLMLSPSSGLCTIYEAMETSEEDEDPDTQTEEPSRLSPGLCGPQKFRAAAPQELEWNMKVDMVQQLINHTLMLCADGSCPLLHLPVGAGGSLSPLESSMWPHLLPQLSASAATVTAVSSYSPDNRCSSPPGDWTVVEVETQH